MVTWKSKIPGCFAGMSAPFGIHPNDHQCAKRMLHLALREGATFEEIIREVRRWLKQRDFTKEKIAEEIERLKDFEPNPFVKRKLGTSWLITWEGTPSATLQKNQIVSVFDYRVSSRRMLEYVEQLYIDRLYSLHEKIIYVRHRKDNPYPAALVRINGVQWEGQITCGEKPSLFARQVKNLKFHTDGNGEETLTWDEIPIPTSLS